MKQITLSVLLIAILLLNLFAITTPAHAAGTFRGTVVGDTTFGNVFHAPIDTFALIPGSPIVDNFTVELLPAPHISSGTVSVKQFGNDTFFFTHKIYQTGNDIDEILLFSDTPEDGGSGFYVKYYKDAGSIGVYDGDIIDIPTDRFILNPDNDTTNVLISIFVPGGKTGFSGINIGVKSSNNDPDSVFAEFTNDTAFILSAVLTTPPSVVGSDPAEFNLSISTPFAETITISFDTQVGAFTDGVIVDSCVITNAGTEPPVYVASGACTIVQTDSTLLVTFDTQAFSDTYVWQVIGLSVAGDTALSDSGFFVIDVDPPYFDSPANAVSIDTSGTIPVFTLQANDTNSGIDTYIMTFFDTAGVLVFTLTVDSSAEITFTVPFDTPGNYTMEVLVFDLGGNTVALVGSDSVAFEIVIPPSMIDIVAYDNSGKIEVDDVAKGLRAKAVITVVDSISNVDPVSRESILVTISSDVDPVGFDLALIEKDPNSGVFWNIITNVQMDKIGESDILGFTNGLTSTNLKKIKVQNGSVITATYTRKDSIVPVQDAITWQAVLVTDLESVRTWPNPFKPGQVSELVFQNLPADPTMTIEVYTVAGDRITTLSMGRGITQQGGQNIARWDGRNDRGRMIASGVYLYVVKSQMGTTVRKFTLVK